jgi:hypothetical protein
VYEHALAVDRSRVSMKAGRDVWWHEVVNNQPAKVSLFTLG